MKPESEELLDSAMKDLERAFVKAALVIAALIAIGWAIDAYLL